MTFFHGPHGPWLIAEIGGNHEGDFDTALRLADLALEAGADAVKFQVYFGDTLVSSMPVLIAMLISSASSFRLSSI